jgi:membrane-bound serine protease (ClpP class)
MTLTYALLLAGLFALFFVLEFMLPSGGVLGVLATICLVSAITLAFTHSSTAGFSFIVGGLAVTPLLFALMVRLWPKTFIGRRILNGAPVASTGGPNPLTAPQADSLVGRVGVAVTDMLPSGLIRIADRRYDAVSLGVAIDRGTAVEVCRVNGRIIQVRPTDRTPENSGEKNQDAKTPTLETPVESLGIEDFSDPLG